MEVVSINTLIRIKTDISKFAKNVDQNVVNDVLGKFMQENEGEVFYYCRMPEQFSLSEAKLLAESQNKSIVIYERINGPM